MGRQPGEVKQSAIAGIVEAAPIVDPFALHAVFMLGLPFGIEAAEKGLAGADWIEPGWKVEVPRRGCEAPASIGCFLRSTGFGAGNQLIGNASHGLPVSPERDG